MAQKKKVYKIVLCAVRGQLESRATAKKAIQIALEHEASLHYCYIIDVEFMKSAAPTLAPIRQVYRQLEEMSEFALSILRDRSIEQGLEDVDYKILKGEIPRQLIDYSLEINADVIVLGTPIMKSMGKSVFTPKQFDAFVEKIKSEIGIDVVEVRPKVNNDLKDFPGYGKSSD